MKNKKETCPHCLMIFYTKDIITRHYEKERNDTMHCPHCDLTILKLKQTKFDAEV